MCIHPLYIFTLCGHFLFAPDPLLPCPHFSVAPTNTSGFSTDPNCRIRGHPFTSRFVERLCLACTRREAADVKERRVRLEEAVGGWVERVEVEEWKWRVAYGRKEMVEKGNEMLDLDLGGRVGYRGGAGLARK